MVHVLFQVKGVSAKDLEPIVAALPESYIRIHFRKKKSDGLL